MQNNSTLSVCMIVKNEERFIKDCLASIKSIADQIVIIDTGCTDKTLEIAKEYSAEIHAFQWINDFSAARNASISYAKCDWILWLDADERLTAESIPLIKSELVKVRHPLVYDVQIENMTNDAASAFFSKAHRLFNNNRGIRFKNRIHEQIVIDPTFGKAEEKKSRIKLLHLGYALDDDKKSEKEKRNLALLSKMVGENPNDAYAHYTYAQQLSINEDYTESLKHFRKALDLKQLDLSFTGTILNVMSEIRYKMQQYDRALKLAQQSLQKIPEQISAHYMIYRICEQTADFDKAIDAVNKIRSLNRTLSGQAPKIATDIVIDELKLLYTLAILHEKKGSAAGAFSAWEEALKLQPGNEEFLGKAVSLALKLGDWQSAEKFLVQILKINSGRFDALDLLGTVYIKQTKFDLAIPVFETLHEKLPYNEPVKRKLAGLYLKTGKENKAARVLEGQRL